MKGVDSAHRLSAAQSQLLAGQLLSPDSPLCNMALACRIDGVIDPQRMVHAWGLLAGSTDALGIRIVVSDESISQSTGNPAPVLELLDFSASTSAEEQARNAMQTDVAEAIAVDGVLGRAQLIKLSDARWIFYCNLHHTICDATSFSVLWRRLADVYTNLPDTEQPEQQLTTESAFIEFVRQTERKQSVEQLQKPQYLSKLQDIGPPALFGRRPSRDDTAATRVAHPLTSEQSDALLALASLPQARGFGAGIGNVNVLLSLLVILLHRLGAGGTQNIGIPLPQRQDMAFKETVGLFVEVLPVQIELDDSATFLDVLEQVRPAFLDLLRNASAGDTVEMDAQSIPAVFNYINAPLGNFGDLPADIEWLHSGHIDSQHLLRLQVEDWQGDGNITLAFDFNDAVFNDVRRAQTIEAFWHLFDAMTADLQQTIESVPITDARVIADTSAELNKNKPADSQNTQSVFSCIEKNCMRLGETVAQREGTESISYAMLADDIRHCATQLSDAGIGRGSRVAVYCHRDIRLPQVLLAIHACGAAYVPIDANQPKNRIKSILDDADPAVLIANSALVGNIDFTKVLLVDELFDPETALDESKLPPTALAHVPIEMTDVAYVIYTSGSTGTPKGVAVTHAALANYCQWAMEFYAQGKALSMPLLSPVGFDLTVTSLFLPLMTGGTQCIYNELQYPGVEALSAMLADDLVDAAKLTPAHLSLMNKDNCQQSQRLSQLIVGGEDLPASLAARVDRLFDGRVSIHNEYGPTEATVGCVLHTFDPQHESQGSVPIGKPIADSRVRILNASGQDQLAGCTGELYVAGPSLASGYWQQTQLTESRFVQLPPDNERFYQTGDLVREGDDGNLHCFGRADYQFKLRGHRIEPAEIESALLQHPDIKACVAVLTSMQPDGSAPGASNDVQRCELCGLDANVPGALLGENGVCELCRNYYKYQERVKGYFRPRQEFEAIVSSLKADSNSDYDCIMLLSGGKDSSYALAQLVDMGLRVLAFTLDNGFISESAKQNAARVCAELNVEHRYGSTESMNAIFLDSLQRYANVCNGCFKTIYTLALNLACELNVNCIVTGLSRGQFFETRLSEEWFMAPDYSAEAMDDAIVAARKAYHRAEDVVSCSLETGFLQNDDVFERIKILDFYRYSDVDLDEMYRYLDERLPWVRPDDTGRSTNCLINDTGIYVHRRERGYHNYAHPYSWDVRLGHKQRDAAIDELNDDIDEDQVLTYLDEIGYQLAEAQPEKLTLYYACNDADGGSVTEGELRRWLTSRLPEWMVPTWLVELPAMPLNINGKVDRARLPVPVSKLTTTNSMPRSLDAQPIIIHRKTELLEPQTMAEKVVARIWCRHLQLDSVSVADNFFALGGDSLMAIRITSELNRSGYSFRPADIFEYQTIAQLAGIDLTTRTASAAKSESSAKAAPFASLSGGQLDALSKVLNKKPQS